MTKVTTGVCRASYVHVDKKFAMPSRPGEEPQKEKYSIMLLLPKTDTATLEKLRAAEKEAAKNSKVYGGKVPPKPNSIIRDGDGETDEGESVPEKFPERAGHWYFTVRSDTRPGVVDATGKNRIENEEVYSGCYVRASLSAFAYNFNGKKGLSFALNNLQKVADGEPFGNVSNPEDDFEAFEDELI